MAGLFVLFPLLLVSLLFIKPLNKPSVMRFRGLANLLGGILPLASLFLPYLFLWGLFMVSPQLLRGISWGTSANRSRQHTDFVLKIRGVSYCRGVVGRVFRRNPLSSLRMPLHVGSRLLVRFDGSHLVPPGSFMDSSPEERRGPESSGFHNVSSGSDIGNLGGSASLRFVQRVWPNRSPQSGFHFYRILAERSRLEPALQAGIYNHKSDKESPSETPMVNNTC